MKLRFLVISLFFALCITANARGRLPIFYSAGDHIIKVIDLPETEDFIYEDEDGNEFHVDLGILHKQFTLFKLPIVNYGTEEYVLYTDQDINGYDFTYVELTEDDIEDLQIMIGDFPSEPKLPFWDAWGGKLVFVLIIALIIIIAMARKDKEGQEKLSKDAANA